MPLSLDFFYYNATGLQYHLSICGYPKKFVLSVYIFFVSVNDKFELWHMMLIHSLYHHLHKPLLPYEKLPKHLAIRHKMQDGSASLPFQFL